MIPQGSTAAPKITVVIPTRERLPVLRHCVRTVLAQPYGNLQILISDNASADGTGSFVQSIDDPRVRYLNTGRRLSMSGNWEFALSHVDDGWVMFLGDDDGLLPGAIARLADVIATTDCEAIAFRGCNYIWPGASGSHYGRLIVPFCGGREVRQTSDWLQRVMNARAGYTSLPMIYDLGLVSMRLVDRIPRQDGRFFNSSIPDVYACLAIARSTPRYVYVNQPFALIGCSKFSNGASFMATSVTAGSGAYRMTESADNAEYRRFVSENDMAPHPGIAPLPGCGHPPSLQMFVYEAFLQSQHVGGDVPEPTPACQLALALTHSYGPNRSDAMCREWGRGFARLHGVDFDAAWSEAQSLRRRAKVAGMCRRLHSGLESLAIFDPAVPLENVHAASLAAAAALWTRPSATKRLVRNGRYAAERLSRR